MHYRWMDSVLKLIFLDLTIDFTKNNILNPKIVTTSANNDLYTFYPCPLNDKDLVVLFCIEKVSISCDTIKKPNSPFGASTQEYAYLRLLSFLDMQFKMFYYFFHFCFCSTSLGINNLLNLNVYHLWYIVKQYSIIFKLSRISAIRINIYHSNLQHVQ